MSKVEERHLSANGLVCPNCGSGGISGSQIQVDEGYADQEMVCNSCNAAWVDHYQLIGFSWRDRGGSDE